GYQAQYRYGRISLTASQFYDWSGIPTSGGATAACQLLSSGAIPAVVYTAPSTTIAARCPARRLSVDPLLMSHVWVTVTLGGTDSVFDPSYKPHTFISGINLNSTAGLTTGDAENAATGASSGMTSGTDDGDSGPIPGATYVRSLNASALATTIGG